MCACVCVCMCVFVCVSLLVGMCVHIYMLSVIFKTKHVVLAVSIQNKATF